MRKLSTTVKHIAEQNIRSELITCGVPIVTLIPEDRIEEVPSTIGGHLNGFRFIRAETFWVVGGRVPLAVAYEIYSSLIGHNDIRVGGEDCLPPAGYLVSWQTPDGRTILPIQDRLVTDRLVAKGMIKQSEVDRTFLFVDLIEFAKYGEPYTTLYHIDTQEALNYFVDTLRKHRLV